MTSAMDPMHVTNQASSSNQKGQFAPQQMNHRIANHKGAKKAVKRTNSFGSLSADRKPFKEKFNSQFGED